MRCGIRVILFGCETGVCSGLQVRAVGFGAVEIGFGVGVGMGGGWDLLGMGIGLWRGFVSLALVGFVIREFCFVLGVVPA